MVVEMEFLHYLRNFSRVQSTPKKINCIVPKTTERDKARKKITKSIVVSCIPSSFALLYPAGSITAKNNQSIVANEDSVTVIQKIPRYISFTFSPLLFGALNRLFVETAWFRRPFSEMLLSKESTGSVAYLHAEVNSDASNPSHSPFSVSGGKRSDLSPDLRSNLGEPPKKSESVRGYRCEKGAFCDMIDACGSARKRYSS